MARLLSLDEALEADVFFYESRCVYDSDYGRASSVDGYAVSIQRMGLSGWAYEDPESYGSAWRCWDSRPEDKERKAVSWKEI